VKKWSQLGYVISPVLSQLARSCYGSKSSYLIYVVTNPSTISSSRQIGIGRTALWSIGAMTAGTLEGTGLRCGGWRPPHLFPPSRPFTISRYWSSTTVSPFSSLYSTFPLKSAYIWGQEKYYKLPTVLGEKWQRVAKVAGDRIIPGPPWPRVAR